MFYFPIPEEKKKSSKVVYDCAKCGLNTNCITPKMKPYGNMDSKLVILGEAPGRTEDEKGIPFCGDSGDILRSEFRKNKISVKNHTIVLNAVSCRPPGNKISDTYLRCCRPILKERLHQIKPNLIICFGESAINSILNLFGEKEGITKLRNRLIPSYEFNCMVYATYHPAALMYNRSTTYSFEKDVERIVSIWNRFLHRRKEVNKTLQNRQVLKDITIREIKSSEELLKVAEILSVDKKFAFDYETTNVKPYDDNFEIWCLTLSTKKNAWTAYVPDIVDLNKFKEVLIKLLNDKSYLKIIQNAKFEELATKHWFYHHSLLSRDFTNYIQFPWDVTLGKQGQIIRNTFDTMLATHTVDERGGCTSLDFQNLVRFGIPKYSNKVAKYLKAEKGEKKNKIHLCPKEDLIQYCSLDGITTFNQYIILDKMLNEGNLRWCYEFLLEGHELFAEMTWNGFPVSETNLEKIEKNIDRHRENVYNKIMNLQEVKDFLKGKEKASGTVTRKLEKIKLKRRIII